jgi:predicted ATPase
MAETSWASDAAIRVRMGLHTGTAEERGGDYFGAAVNRAARVGAIAHGGQIVLSAATAELLADERWTLIDVGRHRLRGLERPERLFRLVADDIADNDAPLRQSSDVLGNLPRQRAEPIGRDDEIELLLREVVPGSLLTITGVGGVGKTRLAVTAARKLAERFVDGAWLIELSELTAATEVAAAVADVMRMQIPDGIHTAPAVARAMRHQQCLLVIDNCEHVVDGAAQMVEAIAARCPEIAIIATSRQPLSVDGERVISVQPLGLASDGTVMSEAAQLFCQRAASAAGRFQPTAVEVPMVELICQRLDGLPLAIELAATRLSAMTVAELDARLSDRFRLAKQRGDSSDRHHSLRTLVAWSYELLTPDERALFEQLSVFGGSFDLGGAEAMADDGSVDSVVDALVALVDKSLVVAERGPSGTRYHQLETLREFGLERLLASGRLPDIRRRHLWYFVSLTQRADAGIKGPEELRWHQTLTNDWHNVRQALTFACDADLGDAASQLLRNVLFWAVNRLPMEMTDWSNALLELPSAADHPLRPVVAASASYFMCQKGDMVGARQLIDLAYAEEVRLDAPLSPYVPALHVFCVDTPDGYPKCVREVFRRAGDDVWAHVLGALQEALWCAAVINAVPLTPDEIEPLLATVEAAVVEAERLGNPCCLAYSSIALGTHLGRTDPAKALALLQRGLDLAEPLDLRLPTTNAQCEMAKVLTDLGRSLEALAHSGEAAQRCRRQGADSGAWEAVLAGLRPLADLGALEVVARCLAQANADKEVLNYPGYFGVDDLEQRLRTQLGVDAMDALMAEGAALDRTSATALAIEAMQQFVA